MPITFSCPKCQSRMTVPDEVAGKKGKCRKCQEPLVVPTANGEAAAATVAPPLVPSPAPVVGTAARAAPAKVAAAKPPAPSKPKAEPPPAANSRPAPVPPPLKQEAAVPQSKPAPVPKTLPPAVAEEPPAEDVEAAALEAFADPKEQVKTLEHIAFDCPNCGEALKIDLAEGGKKIPCPECRRIISVPMPKVEDRKDWRNTGPKLPAGARREDAEVPAGGWDAKKSTVSDKALEEAGVIQEKHKPATLLQRAFPYLVVYVLPACILLTGSYFLYHWIMGSPEQRALALALSAAAAPTPPKAFGPDGFVVLNGRLGEYYLRSDAQRSAIPAKDHFGKSAVFAAQARNAGTEAFMGELGELIVELGGNAEQIDLEKRIKWDEVQRLLRIALAAIESHQGRLEALRRVVPKLIKANQAMRVIPLVAQIYSEANADRLEAMAFAGLELQREGKTDDATKVLTDILAAYNGKKRPALRGAVVALATVLGKAPPAPGKSIEEEEAQTFGLALAAAHDKKMDEARAIVNKLSPAGGGRFRVWVMVLESAFANKSGDAADLATAADLLPTTAGRPEFSWSVYRLYRLGFENGLAEEKLEALAAGIPDRGLASQARLLAFRKKLAAGQISGLEGLDTMADGTAAKATARVELVRYLARRDSSWEAKVRAWEAGPQALGSIGAAMGIAGR